jgi:hypothetical protein
MQLMSQDYRSSFTYDFGRFFFSFRSVRPVA